MELFSTVQHEVLLFMLDLTGFEKFLFLSNAAQGCSQDFRNSEVMRSPPHSKTFDLKPKFKWTSMEMLFQSLLHTARNKHGVEMLKLLIMYNFVGLKDKCSFKSMLKLVFLVKNSLFCCCWYLSTAALQANTGNFILTRL